MNMSWRMPSEDMPMELTDIWLCAVESCNGWMRDNFTFSFFPKCSQCQSDMVKSEKMLCVVANMSPNQSKE